MSEEAASLMLWVFGVIVFLIAMYSVAQAGKEMNTFIKRRDQTPTPKGH